ncbi:hypothetical protein CEXT_246601 [Caerostris extrusa]|uniref:Uncharacterized protein n=1 Tax=Caerostris extrusa TaxID=172846 RepID=A0AAV4QHD1_CAEEX|nr:hypothetical protein CEXT_246601 [Caerostris extrusa]
MALELSYWILELERKWLLGAEDLHRDLHKSTCRKKVCSPVGNALNQNDHVLIDAEAKSIASYRLKNAISPSNAIELFHAFHELLSRVPNLQKTVQNSAENHLDAMWSVNSLC